MRMVREQIKSNSVTVVSKGVLKRNDVQGIDFKLFSSTCCEKLLTLLTISSSKVIQKSVDGKFLS